MHLIPSASLYIHIPFCLQRCRYCDFFSIKKSEYSKIYHDFMPFIHKIIEDIFFFKNRYKIGFWETVYVGGGTPSLLSSEEISFLAHSICSSQNQIISEFTIEANPEDINKDWLIAAYNSGVNRLSVGVQSLSDIVLTKERRRGSRSKTINALELISSVWNKELSLDFIAGLERQTENTLIEDLKLCLNFKPHHISLYELMSEKKISQFQKDRIAKIWDVGAKYLRTCGFEQYEISNFAINELYNSKHNTNYWNLKNYVGVGPGAVGSVFFENCSDKIFAERFSGLKNIKSWGEKHCRKEAYETEKINFNELIEETIMMAFRLKKGLNRKSFFSRFDCDILSLIPKTVHKWQDKKMLCINKDYVYLSEKGFLFLNKFLIECFTELDF